MFQRKPEDDLLPPWVRSMMSPLGDAHEPTPQSAPAAPVSYPGPPDPTALLPWIDTDLAIGPTDTKTGDETRASHAPVQKRVADSGPPIPKGAKYDPRWTAMAQGTIAEAAAPRTVRIPDAVGKGLDEAWTKTVNTAAKGPAKEYGGNIVRTYGGEYKARGSGGESTHMFEQDEHDVPRWGELTGVYHTHLYDDIPGQPHSTFSEGDVSSFASHDQNISLLRSGDMTYMMARTKEFEAMQAEIEKETDGEKLMAKRAQFQQQIEKFYNGVYKKAGGDENRAKAMDAAMAATAKQYHLAYYAGKGNNLSRVGAPAQPAK